MISPVTLRGFFLMAENKTREAGLTTVLESTIKTLLAISQKGKAEPVFGDLPDPPHDDPNSVPLSTAQPEPEKEQAAFEAPSKEDTDDIQYLDLVSVRFKLEREEIETGKLREQVEGLRAQNRNHNAIARGRKIDNRLRLQMANLTFKFMQYWCSFVALIVFIYVAKKDGDPDPTVVIALLGTSTISIVGLVGFVVSGLFKSNHEKDSSDKDKKE